MIGATHPHRNRLLGFQLGELDEAGRREVAGHAEACEECRDYLTSLAEIVSLLGVRQEEEPPAGGLERVLNAVARSQATMPHGQEWLRAALASLAGVTVGTAAFYAAGSRLATLPSVARLPLVESLGVLSGLGIAALVFFGIGSLVVLALAPMLILDRQPRRRPLAAG